MKKISSTDRASGKSQGRMAVRTGSHCPANGLWRPVDSSAEPMFVFEGSMMPTRGGESAMWMLVDAGRQTRSRRQSKSQDRTS